MAGGSRRRSGRAIAGQRNAVVRYGSRSIIWRAAPSARSPGFGFPSPCEGWRDDPKLGLLRRREGGRGPARSGGGSCCVREPVAGSLWAGNFVLHLPGAMSDVERPSGWQASGNNMSAGNPSHMLPSGGFFDNWLILFEQVSPHLARTRISTDGGKLAS